MTYQVSVMGQWIDPDRLLVVELAGSATPIVAASVRYVPAVDGGGRRAVAIEISHDAAVSQPTTPYFCPEERLRRVLAAPRSVRRIRPYR